MNEISNNAHDQRLIAIGKGLCLSSASTDKIYSMAEITQWAAVFGNYQPEELEAAFISAARVSRQPATIAGIQLELDRLRHGGLSGAWQLVQSTALYCRRNAKSVVIVFELAAIHSAIETLGGWSDVMAVMPDRKERAFARKAFDVAMSDYRDTIAHPAGFGHFNGGNVVLIGNQERAKEVYRRGEKPWGTTQSGVHMLANRIRKSDWHSIEEWPDSLEECDLEPPPAHCKRPPDEWLAESKYPWRLDDSDE